MRILLVGGETRRLEVVPANGADAQHVRVVPSARTGVHEELLLLLDSSGDRRPGVEDVSSGPPALRADIAPPRAHVLHPVLAERKDYVALLVAKRSAHDEIGVHRAMDALPEGDIVVVAPVVLEVVESPVGKCLRVELLVLPAARGAPAGKGAGTRIDAGLEPLRVDVVDERLHVGEARICRDAPFRVAQGPVERRVLLRALGDVLPEVVDVYVGVSVVGKPA